MKSLKPYKVLKALQKAGFYIHHQKGSHIALRHKEDITKRVTLSLHKKELKFKTLKSILVQTGLSFEDLEKLL